MCSKFNEIWWKYFLSIFENLPKFSNYELLNILNLEKGGLPIDERTADKLIHFNNEGGNQLSEKDYEHIVKYFNQFSNDEIVKYFQQFANDEVPQPPEAN